MVCYSTKEKTKTNTRFNKIKELEQIVIQLSSKSIEGILVVKLIKDKDQDILLLKKTLDLLEVVNVQVTEIATLKHEKIKLQVEVREYKLVMEAWKHRATKFWIQVATLQKENSLEAI